MKAIFNFDGPLFSGLSRLCDLIVLNLLFILCSLPIFTIGASLTALSYVMLKIREKEEGYIVRSFFRAFKQNFKQATAMWLILLVAGIIMFLDFWIMRSYEGSLGRIIRICVYLGALIWLMVVSYAFPLLARFDNTVKNTLQNALLIAIANAPKTMLMLAVMIGAVFLTLWNATTLVWGILVWLLIGFSLISFVNSTLQVPIFHKLAPQEDEATEGTGEDGPFFGEETADEQTPQDEE